MLCISKWKNYPTSHLVYYLSEEFMVPIASFKYSSIYHDVHFRHHCQGMSGSALGHGNLVADKLEPKHVLGVSVSTLHPESSNLGF